MTYKYLIPLFITSISLTHGVVVKNEVELNAAINSANAGAISTIQFGSNIDYSRLIQPLNADNVLNSLNQTFTIDGQKKYSLTSTSGYNRGFFARTSEGTVTIKDLTISNAHAKGGDGGNRGGGGLGAGGGLFLNKDSHVILDNVSFENCRATGGESSGSFGGPVLGANGGGGLGGDGGAANTSAGGGGGFSGSGGVANGLGGSGGGGYNGKGGACDSYGGGGGGGGGFKGGNSKGSKNGGGGAGDLEGGEDVISTGVGGTGGRGTLPGGVGGTGIADEGNYSGGGGSGAVRGMPGGAASNSQGGSSPGGGGGGGFSSDPSFSTAGGHGGPGFGGGGSGAADVPGLTGNGGDGGFGGGGGGSGHNTGTGGTGNGGDGGFGGGGGGAGNGVKQKGSIQGLVGGHGGFGGGGGGAGTSDRTYKTVTGKGGNGGFGGGGGGAAGNDTENGIGGFGGGKGGVTPEGDTKGGGGAAMGADIFIQDGATLTIQRAISFSGSALKPGKGFVSGQAYGTNIFMMSEGQIYVENLNVDSTVPNPIESDQAADNRDPNKGGLTLLSGNTATFTLNGENTYTGQTIIQSGTLQLNGSVITPVILYDGVFTGDATLKVNKIVDKTGNLIIYGGVVSPSKLNSYGTMNIGKNLQFTDGAFQMRGFDSLENYGELDVENTLESSGGTFLIRAFDSLGNSDKLDVEGKATLGGTVTAEKAIGNFLKGQTIPIIEAEGGITGKFENVNLPPGADGFPLFNVQYNGTTAEIVVLRDHIFVHPYIKPGNPRHVAKYIRDQLPIEPSSDFGLVIRSLGVLSDKELNKVLNMMHQGVFGSFEGMNLTTNAQIMQLFNQHRFRLYAEENPETISALELQLTASAEGSRPFYPNAPIRRGCKRDLSKPHHVYLQPFGTWNSQSQKGELRGFQYESAGFLTGYDYLFDHFYVGAGLGYAYTNFRWSSSAGKGHIHQVYGGLHGSYFNRYFSAVLGSMVGGNFYETDRRIIASAPGFPNGFINRTAHSNNSGIQWTNHLGLIGDLSSLSVPLQIFANVDHFYLHNNSFNESGAGSINLRVNSKTSNALRSELGLSSSYTFHFASGCWTPYAQISWVNKTVLSNSTYRGGFRGQVGTFSASATTKGTNQWSPGLGIEFANTHGFSLLLNSRAEINGKLKNYSADMRMEYAF